MAMITPKVDIKSRYPEESETNRPDAPYKDFYEVLSTTFDMNSVNSIIDIGCSDGNLINIINKQHPHIEVLGLEYFDYHKKHSDPNVVDRIMILDIRDPLPEDLKDKKFDIVICTEVGEHIDPAYTTQFLENIKSLTGQLLIMTWSRHGGENERHKDPLHQHLNPLEFDQFFKVMSNHGFLFNDVITSFAQSVISSKRDFYFWWRESFTVWSK